MSGSGTIWPLFSRCFMRVSFHGHKIQLTMNRGEQETITLPSPETNSSPLKIGPKPNRICIFPTFWFSGATVCETPRRGMYPQPPILLKNKKVSVRFTPCGIHSPSVSPVSRRRKCLWNVGNGTKPITASHTTSPYTNNLFGSMLSDATEIHPILYAYYEIYPSNPKAQIMHIGWFFYWHDSGNSVCSIKSGLKATLC